MNKTINIDVSVHYCWYDHLILRENGDAKIVMKSIEDGDFETFMKMYEKYPPSKIDYYGKEIDLIYFPDEAFLWYKDDIVGFINITNPTGFSLITSAEYECG
jgi:hypothetical protein